MSRLRELRELYGYTQDYVAEAIGTSRITYVRYENDMRNIRGPELIALASLYHVSVDYILGEASEDNKTPTVEDGGLRSEAIARISALSDPELQRMMDFLSGIQAGREIAAAPPAPPESSAQSSPEPSE